MFLSKCVLCVCCVCGTSEKMKNFYPLISLLCLFDSLTLHDLSSNFNFIQQGAVAPLQVYCQRRHLQLVVIPDLISLAYLRFSVMGRGSTQEPPCRPFEHVNFFCTVVAIWNYFRPIMIGSAASEPSFEQGRRKHTSH